MLGLGPADARDLGRELGQDAVFVWDATGWSIHSRTHDRRVTLGRAIRPAPAEVVDLAAAVTRLGLPSEYVTLIEANTALDRALADAPWTSRRPRGRPAPWTRGRPPPRPRGSLRNVSERGRPRKKSASAILTTAIIRHLPGTKRGSFRRPSDAEHPSMTSVSLPIWLPHGGGRRHDAQEVPPSACSSLA